MYDIISIGSATRDVFIGLDEFKTIKSDDFISGKGLCLSLGSKLEIKKIVFTTGGGGTNAAVTFARQGLKTAGIGVVSQDSNGKEILAELEREGIDIQYFQKHEDDHTAYSVILVDKSGERTILSYKGEGQHFEFVEVPFDKLQSKWLFLDSLGGHYDLLEGAVNWAVKNDIKLAANPGSKELAHGIEKWKSLLKNFSIFWLNQEEAANLTGIDIKKEKEIFKYLDYLVDGICVMTKGPEGMVVSDGKTLYRAGVPDSPIVERTGAGDASCSGFIAEYIRSGDIIKAIQFGTANASSVVAQYGAKAGILNGGDTGPWPLVKVETEQL
mgnify:CR=1 FL=1